MKKISLILLTLFSAATSVVAQESDLDALLAAGVEDAQRFANDYLAPGTNGVMYSMNANWFNSAEAKPLGGFEVAVVLNAATVKDENKSFLMDTAAYNNVRFVQGPAAQSVATALGENNPEVVIEITYDDPIFGEQTEQITLPNGLASQNINLIPTAFIQGSVGLIKGTEVKARFVPKVDTEDVKIGLYGVGIQHEFTKWLPADKLFPVAISGLVAYTHLDASYDFTGSTIVQGENQRLENDTNTWLFQLIGSTKLPVINFYGGIGYISGEAQTDMLGTYRVSNGIVTSEEIVDPFSVTSKVSGVRATLGTKLKLGFFRLNAEYHLAEFNSFSVGVNLGFR